VRYSPSPFASDKMRERHENKQVKEYNGAKEKFFLLLFIISFQLLIGLLFICSK
jgi:hypothetical protein